MVDDIIVGFEDAVGEPIVAEELPDVFDRVELGAFRRQRNYGDVCRHHKTGRQVPAGLIDQEDGVGAGRDSFGDFRQVQVHGLGVAGRQDQAGALALVWADRAEDVGGSGALVTLALGRVPRLAHRRVILFFWPMRASSANQISIVWQSSVFSRAIVSRRVGKLF